MPCAARPLSVTLATLPFDGHKRAKPPDRLDNGPGAALFPGPMSAPTGYRVSFTRIGRKHDVAPLDVLGITDPYEDPLLDAVYAYARPRLGSKEAEVYVNTDEMRGVIIVGSGRPVGEFTITAVTR